ncbi:MAG: TraX family protein [Gemmiger sp.]
MLNSRRAGVSGTTLKWMALALMLLDHIHYMFEFTGAVPVWFTMAGRLSAPLFLFCTAEGFAHTHDRRRYFLRIWGIASAMGLIEVLFMLGYFHRADGFWPQNGIFSDFVLLCLVWQGIDWLRERRFARGAGIIAAVVLWPFAASLLCQIPGLATPVAVLCQSLLPAWSNLTDGGVYYLIGGVILYLLRGHRTAQLSCWAFWVFATEFCLTAWLLSGTEGFTLSQMFTEYFQWFSVFAVLPMSFYNGERGAGHKQVFYWFYPAHVYLLYGLSCLLCCAG